MVEEMLWGYLQKIIRFSIWTTFIGIVSRRTDQRTEVPYIQLTSPVSASIILVENPALTDLCIIAITEQSNAGYEDGQCT